MTRSAIIAKLEALLGGRPGLDVCATRTLEGAPPKPVLLGWGCCFGSLTIDARAQSRCSLALDEFRLAYPGLTSWAIIFWPSGPQVVGVGTARQRLLSFVTINVRAGGPA